MNRSRIPSPARSQGVVSTPRKHTPRRSRSVCSAKSNASARLTNLIADSFHLSPMPNRRSVLNDNTDIEVPGRKSWWKKLGENSRDVMEVLNNKDIAGVNNVAEEFDVEIFSQEKKNYSLDLPESSDGESINSIVIPQRKLFTQKENQPQKNYKHIIDNRETLAKLQKSHFEQEKDINVGPKNLFNNASKPRSKPAFPAALLNISSKAVNKTKEIPAPEVKGQVRNLFGNRPGTKRKNMFADFIVSESEDEISDIQPKVFGFQKNAQKRRESSTSRGVGHSPTSSIDLELDDWKHLPSSTMVENLLDEETTPVKRARLSKLSQAKESDTVATNNTANKTRQSNKSATSSNKSKASTSKLKDVKGDEVLSGSKIKENLSNSKNNQSLNTSSNIRMTRNKSKSMRESSLKEEEHTRLYNKSQNKSQSLLGTPMEVDENNENVKEGLNQQDVGKEVKNMSTGNGSGDDDEDFTLEYENDDEPPVDDIVNKSNENIDLVDAVAETKSGEEEAIDKSNKIRSHMSNKEELADANLEKQNKSAIREKEVNQSRNKVKQNQSLSTSKNISRKSQNASVGEVHQKPQKEAVIEKDQMDNDKEIIANDIENTDGEQNFNHSIRRNDSTKANDDNEAQNENDDKPDTEQLNESSQTNNEIKIQNKSRKSEAEIKERNESSQSNKDIQNESVLSDVESEKYQEEDNNENFDETVIEAEEKETENEQDESEHEQEPEEHVQEEESENEQETEKHVQEEESENEQETEEHVQGQESENEEKTEDQAQEEESENEQETEEQAQEEESENEQETEEQAQEDESENEQEIVEQAQEDESENEQEYEEQVQEQESENEQESEAQVQEDESENEQENEEHVQEEESENDQESEAQIQQDESQNINSDNQDQNDSESNEDETEEQEDEEMEVDEEENESEQTVSDDNLQNETNLSQNSEQEDQVESDQEQGEDDPENEVIETSNHDTTEQNKKKNTTNVKSPEVILHDKTNQMESFTAEGRNTSIRKTKSVIKNLTIKPSLAPVRESVGFLDGTRDSSAEGSGWDSHRTTRKTLRLTLGKDFTPRKSLRALVMEKSAKRQTNINEVTTKIPQANSTELPAFDSYHDAVDDNDTVEEPSDHEISARTRQTTLETYLQKIKQENLEKKRKMEEDIRASLKAPTRDFFNPFKVPLKPVRRMKPVQNKAKPKPVKSTIISLDMLPSEVLEDMKYKPPKRFQPSNASWITKRLYKFLENKLEPKYDYKARVRAERLVELLYGFTREVKRGPSDQATDTLKKEMARLEIVKTHFDFYEFFHEFMPREIRVKVVPDIVNKLSLPRGGVFSEILQ